MGCIFCGGRPLTNEHVLAKWLAGPLGVQGNVRHVYSEPPDDAPPTREWRAGGLDIKVKAVCGPCNEGWMNDLEGQVRPFLGPMIEGRAKNLSPTDCQALTSWLLKTVLMLQLAEP